MKLRLERDCQHERFTGLYKAAGLEIDEGWTAQCHPVETIAVYNDDEFLGAATVSYRLGAYILDYVAVVPEGRGQGAGSFLVRQCLDICRAMGCGELFLAARVPLFFKTLGAVPTGGDSLLAECKLCVDYLNGCEPVEMKFDL